MRAARAILKCFTFLADLFATHLMTLFVFGFFLGFREASTLALLWPPNSWACRIRAG